MSTYLTILGATIPVFIVLGMGYFARVRDWLSPCADGSVMKLVINALYPFLILTFLLGNPALRNPANIGYGVGAGALTVILSISLSYILAPLGGMHVGTGRRTFAFATGLNNYAYIAIPVAGAVFGINSPTMGVLLVCNVGNEAMLWTYGLLILTGKFDRSLWKRLLNPTMIAMLVGLILNFSGVTEMGGGTGRAYNIFLAALRMMGACAVPLGLFISGATMCDLVRTGEWLGRWQVPVLGVLLRNAILPALFILMALALPFPTEIRQVLAVQAAMPAAMFPIVLARYYGGSPAVAVQVILASTVFGLISIPLILATGLRLLT